MRGLQIRAPKSRLARAARRIVEYSVTIGLALLSSYWIVHGGGR